VHFCHDPTNELRYLRIIAPLRHSWQLLNPEYQRTPDASHVVRRLRARHMPQTVSHAAEYIVLRAAGLGTCALGQEGNSQFK